MAFYIERYYNILVMWFKKRQESTYKNQNMFIQNTTKAPGATSGRPDTGCNALWQTLVKNNHKKTTELVPDGAKKKKILDAKEFILTCYPGKKWEGALYNSEFKKNNQFFTPQFKLQRLLLDSKTALFLCKRDLHGISLRDFKALQWVSSSAGLNLVLKLHEGDVVATRDQTHLLEPWEPVEGEEKKQKNSEIHYELIGEDTHTHKHNGEMLLTGWRALTAWARSSPRASWWGRECDWEGFPKPAGEKEA